MWETGYCEFKLGIYASKDSWNCASYLKIQRYF